MAKDNIGKYFVVRGAQPHTKEQEPERVYITINGCFPHSLDDEAVAQLRQGFKEDAEKLFEALMCLPGGTFCQLLVLMLQEKASQFIVSHKPTAEYQKMERASPMLALLEKALPIIEVEANVRDNALSHKGESDQNVYWTEMRSLANEIAQEIDRARGKEVKING